RFVDQNGYLVTGDENSATQFNLFNEELELGDEWVAYHAGQEESYQCASCHTTGYNAQGTQDGLEGMVGSFAFAGVQCEACHGPGSLHVNNPLSFSPVINRDSAACQSCHTPDSIAAVEASDGFIQHHEQYDDLFPGKHALIDCVVCHDPHSGVVQLREANEQTTRVMCENCHLAEAEGPVKAHDRIRVGCLECHMPKLIQNAVGAPEQFTGDFRTHMVSINPELIDQFTETDAGLVSATQISLSFACRHCHNPDGFGPEVTDAELQDAARDYHNPELQTAEEITNEAQPADENTSGGG
ncbi:MAG: multiheme c-type cytochrome, partial [Candidatus Promineifilaceae bacterium]